MENKQRVTGGAVWAKWVRGIKESILKSLLQYMLTNLDVNFNKIKNKI